MANLLHLGIDIGTSSAKCLAVDETGNAVALTQRHYSINHPRENWAEQDAEDFWVALCEIVRMCVLECEARGFSKSDIRNMALSAQGDTLIVTDSIGKPLAPAISWMDTRPGEECRELLEIKDQVFWYQELGIMLTPYSTACKIRWIDKHEPELRKRIAKFCWIPDFLAWRLTGRHVSDVSSASWSPYLCPSTRTFSKLVTDLLGIGRETLPEVVESGETIGELTQHAAEELGLPAGVTLVAGGFDQAVAAHGAGVRPSERSVLSCGTAWVLYSASNKPPIDPQCRVPICCHVRPDQWGMVLPFSGGAAYDWLNATLGTEKPSEPSNAEPPIFIPHLYGSVCPDWREDAKGSLVGLTMAHTFEDVRLALMRGIACDARRNFEVAEELSGRIGSVRMVGGAGKSDTWPQIIANMFNKPVEVSDLVESACYGAAKLAAGDASQEWGEIEACRIYEPNDECVDFENRQYRRYIRFYEALLPQYAIDSEED